MAQRGKDAGPLSPLAASTGLVALPRQLSPISQKRPSTPVAALGSESVAVAAIHHVPNAVDPLVSPQQQQHPVWAATHEQRSRTLAMFPATRKQSAQRKHSTNSRHGSDGKRASISSTASVRQKKHSSVSIRFPVHSTLNNERESDREELDSGDDEEGDEDENYAHAMIHKLDVNRVEKQFRDSVCPSMYEDGGKAYCGSIDRRGITPSVTFTTTETPPSQAKNPAVASTPQHATSCGFCSSTNLVWTLRCVFCGCTRMSDAPRLKYLIDMVLSVEPYIKPEKVRDVFVSALHESVSYH